MTEETDYLQQLAKEEQGFMIFCYRRKHIYTETLYSVFRNRSFDVCIEEVSFWKKIAECSIIYPLALKEEVMRIISNLYLSGIIISFPSKDGNIIPAEIQEAIGKIVRGK